MMDEQDEGTRTGVWVVLGIVALLLFGLIGALLVRQSHKAAKPVAAAATAKTAAVAAPAAALPVVDKDTLSDAPLAGTVVGTLYFASGSAALAADAGVALAAARDAANAAPSKNITLSGFHDATGSAAQNAELAKQRAKAVREALAGLGVSRDRLVLRKPELTTGGANDKEARRVEVRLVDA
jgi:outer membrane protein OmpA-like peptidoglycan-associated protein